MKRFVSAFLPILFAFHAMGQNGNEWIEYNQPHLKIPVGQDGLYRVTYDDLAQAGFALTRDPRDLQLFHRGVQQAIMVAGENDGVFHAIDYLEFYGRKNDGALDASLFETPANQPHQYYNLYSDTSAYFLTYGPAHGKRISTYNGSSAGLSPDTYHMAERLLVLNDSYASGVDYGNIQKTTFDAGEGWMSPQILQGQERTYSIQGISNASTISGKPVLEILLTGRGPMVHNVELFTGSRLASTLSFPGYESRNHIQEIEWSDIDSSGKLDVKVRVTGAAGSDRVSVGYIRLMFPQQITMTGVGEKVFLVNPNGVGRAYLNIQAPPSGLRLFDITDPNNVVQIAGQPGATLDAVVPSTSVSRKVLAASAPKEPVGMKRVSFRNINPASHNYVIITHPSLRKPSLGYVDPVKAFGEYRSLPEGGGFDTLIVNIDQLYDQFNYGEKSPRAIFQFMKFLASVKMPEYLFLIGKGLSVNYGYHRNPGAFTLHKDLVPTAGYPASDIAFTAGLSGVPHVPAVATGRLAANTPADVAAYLNKVKEHEALPFDDLNRKKILHLSGGIEESEPALFREILRNYEQVAEDVYLGGSVQAIAKQSTQVKLINIAEEVNQGLGLITFFGHSAPNTLDFDIGLVTDPIMGYNNKGKYPFLLMNGCDAGSFFLNAAILGENWITAANKGAVGFIAHSSYGLLSGLQRYSAEFYSVAFGDPLYIRKGIGDVQGEVARRYLQKFGPSPSGITQVQQMVLLGDPALRIFGAEKPDYSTDGQMLSLSSFDGEPVTALTDSFRIGIPVRNYGLASKDDIRLNVKREFNGQVVEYDTIISPVLYADTISFVIRNTDNQGYGINVFTIHVDADEYVDELNEDNNIASMQYFIASNSTRNLFPYNYSIVNSRDVQLSFQNTDVMATDRQYLVQVDTTRTFTSDYKQEFIVNAENLGRQAMTLLERDSVVYYWRTKIATPLANESKEWTLSSFSYIKDGPEGWAQLHFSQYENNASVGLVKDPQLRRIQFKETVSDIAVKTFSSSAGKPQDSVSLRINDVEFNLMSEGGACRNNTINLVAFDRRSTQPYAGIYFKWYEILNEYGGRRLLCGREPYVINSFTPAELATGNHDDLLQYVDNISVGDSVVLFNIGDAGFEQWSEVARQKLGELGIGPGQLADLANGDAVVIFGRKGSPPGTARIFHSPMPSDFVRVDETIAGRFSSGVMSSGAIGPARRWDRFIPRVREVEGVDEYTFTIIGVTPEGEIDTLKTDVQQVEDLSFIDASLYPELEVLFESGDNINLTAVQLTRWLVLYEPVAEGMTFYSSPVAQQVVFEGATLSRNFGFINVSNKTFQDSLVVRYNLANHAMHSGANETKIYPPTPGDTTLFTLTFPTLGKAGLNDLEVFVNPRIVAEKTYDNNLVFLDRHIDVLVDKARPVLEVTFDGRQIANDEYVSTSPEVRIRLWDENPFMLKKDTAGIRIFLAHPCPEEDCAFERIFFERDDLTWLPASDTSDFLVLFSPVDLADGAYTLRVEAEDASGNISGDAPYEIRFRVEREKSIVVSSAYPNPFFFETNFQVMVTGEGATLPSYHLYITTLNGTVVAEMSNQHTMHIGKNMIIWDGMGRHGEQLPNGIYFYRLMITGPDSAQEYGGKVVLQR